MHEATAKPRTSAAASISQANAQRHQRQHESIRTCWPRRKSHGAVSSVMT